MSKNSWIDISVPLNNTMHGWPGNPPTFVTMHCGTAKGDVCNVSAINLSSHTGTHMDAPLHFTLNGTAPAGFTLHDDGSYTFDPSNAVYQHLADGVATAPPGACGGWAALPIDRRNYQPWREAFRGVGISPPRRRWHVR